MKNHLSLNNKISKILLIITSFTIVFSWAFVLPTNASLTDTAKTTTSNITAYSSWNARNFTATVTSSTSIRLNWNHPEMPYNGNWGNYELEWFSDPSFKNQIGAVGVYGQNSDEIKNLQPGKTYYFKITNLNLLEGPNGPGKGFSTTQATIPGHPEAARSYTVDWNVYYSSATVTIDAPSGTFIVVESKPSFGRYNMSSDQKTVTWDTVGINSCESDPEYYIKYHYVSSDTGLSGATGTITIRNLC